MAFYPATSADSSEVQEQSPSERSFVKRWKHQRLFDKGFVAIPSRFLHLYADLKPFPLSTGEALFVIHLMEFKWDANHPFPGYRKIASRMGVSDKMTRRYAQSLETKNYLRRQGRIGQTNRFDLTPLFDALAKAVDEDNKASARARAKNQPDADRLEAQLNWHKQLLDAFALITEEDKRDLAKWKQSQTEGRRPDTSDWPGWAKYIGPKPE